MKPRVSAVASALLVFGTVLLLPPLAGANERRPSLPTSVLSARTIYVDNQTTSAELQNTAYTELSKWGRFQILDAPQKAEIVLRLSNGNHVKFVPGGENVPAATSWPALPVGKSYSLVTFSSRIMVRSAILPCSTSRVNGFLIDRRILPARCSRIDSGT
jgi:hypothetical protein